MVKKWILIIALGLPSSAFAQMPGDNPYDPGCNVYQGGNCGKQLDMWNDTWKRLHYPLEQGRGQFGTYLPGGGYVPNRSGYPVYPRLPCRRIILRCRITNNATGQSYVVDVPCSAITRAGGIPQAIGNTAVEFSEHWEHHYFRGTVASAPHSHPLTPAERAVLDRIYK